MPQADRQRTFWLTLIVASIVILTALNVYRGATQSITHDEAVTYERYVAGPFYQIVSKPDANNHVLFSLLSRATVGLCGPSVLTLRLPSLVASLFFLVVVARIGWRVWGPAATAWAAVLVLGINPFVMDYLSIARGYALALAFWAAALEQLLAAGPMLTSWRLRRASQYLALAVLGNLTFLFAAAALVACWAVWAWRLRQDEAHETPREFRHWLWRAVVRPGAIVMAWLGLPLLLLKPSHFYYGAKTFAESLRSFAQATLTHHPHAWPWNNQTASMHRLVDVVALWLLPALILGIAVLWLRAARRLCRDEIDMKPETALFYLAAGTFTLTAGLLCALHFLIGFKLPIERTGLHLVTPFFLAVLAGGAVLSAHAGAWWRQAVTAGGLLFALGGLAELQTDHYRPWAFEADSRQVFEEIVARYDTASRRRVRVGAYWILVPALNFYRDTRGVDFIEKIERRYDGFPPDTDIYVVAERIGGKLPAEPVVEFYHGTGGTVLALPANRHGPFLPAGVSVAARR
ncbi:MAG: hypothetical protein AB7K24_09510 [Gemmataceae bacterium]